MRFILVVLFACAPITLCAQALKHPTTHVDACNKFSRAVVRIDSLMSGTGFIVSPDGWILTAGHLVINAENRTNAGAISVVMPDKSIALATQVLKIDDALLLRDFALLKVDKTNLPYLELGNEDDARTGSGLTIIGFPLSALSRYGQIGVQFCLTGTIAAQTPLKFGQINVDVVYFQGISIKGISGAPIISLDTGRVIGIADTKLTGISEALDKTRKIIAQGGDIQVIGNGGAFGVAGTTGGIINVLDNQLANGLGSGTGAADAALALSVARRHYKKSPKQ